MSLNLDPIEIGKRLAKVRKDRGLRQEQLGEMIGVTAAAISKYETKGLNAIDIINQIQDVLGVSLFDSIVVDVERPLSDICKEMLFQLVDNNGLLEEEEFDGHLSSLEPAEIEKNLVLLSEMDLAVRERYVDREQEDRKLLFITNRGLIRIKQICRGNDALENKIDSISSYENWIGSFSNLQEYMDNDEFENSIRNIMYENENNKFFNFCDVEPVDDTRATTPYMIDFIQYLKMYYSMPIFFSFDDFMQYKKYCWLASPSCYEHMMLRMRCDLTDDKMRELLFPENGDDFPINLDELQVDVFKNNLTSDRRRFIEENLKPAETEREKRLERTIHKIWENYPMTLNYYLFPDEWETNGLAGMIRERIGLPKERNDLMKMINR